MRQVMLPLLGAFQERVPLLFDDLAERFAEPLREMVDEGAAASLY